MIQFNKAEEPLSCSEPATLAYQRDHYLLRMLSAQYKQVLDEKNQLISERHESVNELQRTYEWRVGNRFMRIARKTRLVKVGRVLRVLKKEGLPGVVRRIKSKVRPSPVASAPPTQALPVQPSPPPMINGYEYKFYRYLSQRNKMYPFALSKVSVHCIPGLVSIVLPIYNGEDTAEEAIQSILHQTYTHFELIIVNDGSTDNTLQIINRFAQDDTRIRIVNQQNQKLPKALNNGFALAQGEFLTWTSADNNLHPEFLQRMVAYMQDNPDVAMSFSNMWLIDDNGDPITDFGWYPLPDRPDGVALPHSTLELNTHPNNTIGAAFMYRTQVPHLVGEYNPSLFTLEDYDYWMRINALMPLCHTPWDQPLYEYRMHAKSLTSRDKELRITERRDGLMRWEDFRQDAYLLPMIWNISGVDEQVISSLKAALFAANHIEMDADALRKISMPMFGSMIIQCVVAANEAQAQCPPSLCASALRVLIITGRDKLSQEQQALFDLVVALGDDVRQEKLLYAHDIETAFVLIDMIAKTKHLRAWEDALANSASSHKLTIALCTHRYSRRVRNALISAVLQDMPRSEYEILLINNNPSDPAVHQMYEEICSQFDLPKAFLRYIDCPLKGLSHARNAAIWEARGEAILYFDDDGVMNGCCARAIAQAFQDHPNTAVVGGQVILYEPTRFKDVVATGQEALWSQFLIPGGEYREAQNQGDYPYGCCFSARTTFLRSIGGFSTRYGRTGNDFAGGEEILVSIIANQCGMKIGLVPEARVTHDVDPSRYTIEHVRKTMLAGVFTNYRMGLDLYLPFNISIAEKEYVVGLLCGRIHETFLSASPEHWLTALYDHFNMDAHEKLIQRMHQDITEMQRLGQEKAAL